MRYRVVVCIEEQKRFKETSDGHPRVSQKHHRPTLSLLERIPTNLWRFGVTLKRQSVPRCEKGVKAGWMGNEV